MRILHLYRPELPGQRAQAIQVLHTCHALARRGHRVTLLADRGPREARPETALASLGLPCVDTLDLRIAPVRQRTMAGMWFRREVARWWSGPPGLILARDKRRLLAALSTHGNRHRIMLETHELDSGLERDAGRDPTPVLAREAAAAKAADVLVANCSGTLRQWETVHGAAVPERRHVVHNATAASRRRAVHPAPDPVVRCVGSFRSFKGLASVVAAAPRLDLPLVLVGGSPSDLDAPPPACVTIQAPVPFPDVPDLLARSAVLLLPLADNRFGRMMTNPLKLWDYLATAVPIVAPALPTIEEVAAATAAPLFRYVPGDAGSLVAAVAAARRAAPRTPFLRTWQDRAAELEAAFP